MCVPYARLKKSTLSAKVFTDNQINENGETNNDNIFK